MDFYQIKERSTKNGVIEVYPDFRICKSKDLKVRGKSFYSIWDEENGVWSTDEYDVQRIVDKSVLAYKDKVQSRTNGMVHAKLMSDFSSKMWSEFRSYVAHISDNAPLLDNNLKFSNSKTVKDDYSSKTLPYPLQKGECPAFCEIIGTLYTPEEREKLEWAIGSIVTGDSKSIQKFVVMFGDPGTGKGTIINIIEKLFQGYYTAFEAKALAGNNNAFATEVFRHNPLVAIQHDGDLSKIEDNTKLNSIVSHEYMTMNEKYKPSYMARCNAFLFMATNRPVKITDAKSGIIRRLIDVRPSGQKLSPHKYEALMSQIDFELGAIAFHCSEVYKKLGKNYYKNYKPMDMIFKTDVFFNFVEAQYFVFKEADGVSLKHAYDMYKAYCEEALINYKLTKHSFREALKDYFETFVQVKRIEDKQIRNYYEGFRIDKFTMITDVDEDEEPLPLVLDSTESLFDKRYKSAKAQYANRAGTPSKKWVDVDTKLRDLNTKKLHYVKPSKNHIVIDFDLKDDEGKKSLVLNMEAASKWPPTYAELSKSGGGIHLHYIYDGDVELLSNNFDEHIEIKVFKGGSSLRRKLTKCNTLPIETINSGLPLKGAKVLNFDAVKSERALRRLVERNLLKEIHPGTKPSVDFIKKILNDAYESGLKFDLTDMRQDVLSFASSSSNQALTCIKMVSEMQFKSDEPSDTSHDKEAPIAFYDVEIFPNLFLVNYKFEGPDKPVHRMINPSAAEVGELLKYNLVGFNCRRYDNHIMYAAYIGYNNAELYNLSQKIVSNNRNALFAEAYKLSYTDVYDFSSKKQSLKKFQLELGIHHQELGLPWDEPVDEKLWTKVAEYCDNDVISTEAVFNARKQDFVARQILAELSGLTVNDTTQRHTARIIFGTDRNPQLKFIYTDLSEEFPGYKYDWGKSTYKGLITGEGGRVFARPGMYGGVDLLDIASMHPNSLIWLNAFGPYTKNFKELMDARLAIKHGDYSAAKKMLNGVLAKYLTNPDDAEALSYALKIVINIVYGLTSAKFENPFKDPRNKDNIVAKRGALFMIDLQEAVEARGYTVAHIKTDSIKIPDGDEEIRRFVSEFGAKYGYTFEYEARYDKMCLVNDAVYIAKYEMVDGLSVDDYIEKTYKKRGYRPSKWTATGAQFKHPYVFKKLFSKAEIEFDDLCETKTVKTALHLDFNEDLTDVSIYEKELENREKIAKGLKSARKPNLELAHINVDELQLKISEGHSLQFVGKAGAFCPVRPGKGGGNLMREKDGKFYAAGGTKGYRWVEAEIIKGTKKEQDIDFKYFDNLAEASKQDIETYGDFEWFTSDQPYDKNNNYILPF